MKIMLIDDLPEQLAAISTALESKYGAGSVTRAISAQAGRAAGNAALAPPWDAIAIDLSLSEYRGKAELSGDGLVLAEIFRKDPNYLNTVIIVYSRGFVDKKDLQSKWNWYSLSGIFACESSKAADMIAIIEEHLGEGPWELREK